MNGKPVDPGRLDEYIRRMETVADRAAEAAAQRPATFFEISTAIAFQYFADEQVDIAVIETGMGGRWDATNVIIPLVSVVTRIDIDHTRYLGDTVEEIAAEKAGIIKAARPVVSAPQSEEVMAVLRREGEPIRCSAEAVSIAREKKRTAAGPELSQVLRIETGSRTLPLIRLPLNGACQRENCAVAVAALEVLADMLDFEPAFKTGLEAVSMPARFQLLQEHPLMILDGAHNPSAARALGRTLRERFPGRPVGFILGFLDDKDMKGFLQEIRPLADRIWTLQVDDPRGARAAFSAQQARTLGLDAEPLEAADAWTAAREWASEVPERLVCATGTLRLAACLPPSTPGPAAGSGS
jgi:dihydrofolate synthase/folylpolyglutamate synthase